MPYDTLNEAEALFKIGDPSLRSLAYILRRRELWPKEFVWNFSHCASCAMGLAAELWYKGVDPWEVIEKLNDLNIDHAINLFTFLGYISKYSVKNYKYYGVIDRPITPEMVADKIDAYLAGKGGNDA